MYLKTLSARVKLDIVILRDFKVNVLVQYFNEPKVGNGEEPMRTQQQRGHTKWTQKHELHVHLDSIQTSLHSASSIKGKMPISQHTYPFKQHKSC